MTDAIIQLRVGDRRWRVLSNRRAALLGDASPDWFKLEHEPRATLVKSGHARTTWRVALADGTVYAKVSRADSTSLVHRVIRFTGASASQREWRALRAAEAIGVPVVALAALGSNGASPSCDVLLLEELRGARGLLDEWMESVHGAPRSQRRRAAQDLINATAELFAESHERGFFHRDPHAGNILVQTPPDAQPRAVFADLQGARLFNQPLPARPTLAALAAFDQYFQRLATRGERMRFLRRYLSLRSLPSSLDAETRESRRRLLEDLAGAKSKHARRLARRRDRRLAGDGTYFAIVSLADGWRATVVARLERRHLFPERDVPDRSESDWREILAPLVAELGLQPKSPDGCVSNGVEFEMEPIEGLGPRIAAFLRGSRHRRMFEQCHRDRHRDIPSPLILGYVEHRSGGLVDRSILIRSVPLKGK